VNLKKNVKAGEAFKASIFGGKSHIKPPKPALKARRESHARGRL